MKRLFVVILSVVTGVSSLFAQPHYTGFSQYMHNGMAINPAYTGTRDILTVSGSYRKQWLGIEGAPEVQTLSIHWPDKKKKVGLGFSLLNQTEDIKSNLQLFANYSYRVQAGPGTLSMGLRAGVLLYNEDMSEILLNILHPADPYFSNLIPRNKTFLNFGTGLYYYTNRFYLGLSIPLMANYLVDSLSHDFAFSFSPAGYSYFLSSGLLVVNSQAFKWKPSALVKYHATASKIQFDLNTTFILFDDLLWLGASYRTDLENTGPALIGMIELKLGDKWMLGYSYDHMLNGLNNYLQGTHEVFLRFEWVKSIRADNPRYF